jgi:homoserine kinase
MPRPAFRGAPAHVRVPATSANLGPGFDALGLALALHDDVVAVVGEDGVIVDVAGEGAEQVARDEKNLVISAMRATFDLLGGQPRGIELSCANRIPHGRGLGSSAAAIVAGVLLARALVLGGEQTLSQTDLLALASKLEGHPDNVAACLLGGLTLAWTDGAKPAAVNAVQLDLDPAVTAVMLVPPNPVSTKTARRALPESVSHADAVHNAARSALLVAALSGSARSIEGIEMFDDDMAEGEQRNGHPDSAAERARVLLAATEDRLHQPYRRTGMTATASLVAALRGAGIAAVLSGAGPSVLALTRGEAQVQTALDLLPKGWWGRPLEVDRQGAHLVVVQR